MTRFNTAAQTTTATNTFAITGTVKKGLALLVVATLVSGCMGNTGGGQKSYQPIQAKEIGDPGKSCSALHAEVAQLDRDLASLNGQIRNLSMSNTAISFLGGFVEGNQATLANVGRNHMSGEVSRLEGIKRSYQARRDVVFQGFFNKRCKAS